MRLDEQRIEQRIKYGIWHRIGTDAIHSARAKLDNGIYWLGLLNLDPTLRGKLQIPTLSTLSELLKKLAIEIEGVENLLTARLKQPKSPPHAKKSKPRKSSRRQFDRCLDPRKR